MRKQRDRHAEGSLEAWKVKLLNEIADFEWSGSKAPKKKKFKLNEDDFEFRFDLLREFIAESGHAVVQQDVVYRGHKLGLWVSQWRSGYFAADGRKITQAQIDSAVPTSNYIVNGHIIEPGADLSKASFYDDSVHLYNHCACKFQKYKIAPQSY